MVNTFSFPISSLQTHVVEVVLIDISLSSSIFYKTIFTVSHIGLKFLTTLVSHTLEVLYFIFNFLFLPQARITLVSIAFVVGGYIHTLSNYLMQQNIIGIPDLPVPPPFNASLHHLPFPMRSPQSITTSSSPASALPPLPPLLGLQKFFFDFSKDILKEFAFAQFF